MPNFKKNTSPAMYKKGPFKMKSSPTKLFGSKQRKARNFEAEQIARMGGGEGSGLPGTDVKHIKKYMLKGKKYDV